MPLGCSHAFIKHIVRTTYYINLLRDYNNYYTIDIMTFYVHISTSSLRHRGKSRRSQMLGYFQKFSYEHGPDGCADTCMLHVTTDDAHQPYILLNFLSLQPGTQGITSACKTEAYIAPEFLLWPVWTSLGQCYQCCSFLQSWNKAR